VSHFTKHTVSDHCTAKRVHCILSLPLLALSRIIESVLSEVFS
jgi:hypothetical protein